MRKTIVWRMVWVPDPDRPKKKYLCCRADFDDVVCCRLVFSEDRKIIGREDIVPMETQLFSTFCLPGSDVAARGIPRVCMILALGYSLEDKQLCVTGSCKVGETPEQAAVREILEETGMVVSAKALRSLHTGYRKKTKHRWGCTAHHFALDVDVLGTDVAIDTEMSTPTGKDDASTKVSVIIHGSRETLMALLTRIGPTDSTEAIAYFAIVPYDTMELVVAKITDASDG